MSDEKKDKRMVIAKAIVAVDDSIRKSNGLADFLGCVIASGISMFFGGEALTSGESKPEVDEIKE